MSTRNVVFLETRFIQFRNQILKVGLDFILSTFSVSLLFLQLGIFPAVMVAPPPESGNGNSVNERFQGFAL